MKKYYNNFESKAELYQKYFSYYNKELRVNI